MTDKRWKEAERRSAEYFTGSRERTGPTGRDLPDFPSATLAPEVKSKEHLPKWLNDAMEQADANSRGKLPFVHLMEKGEAIEKTLIVLRADEFKLLLELTGRLG